MRNETPERLYDRAVNLWAEGHDNDYIRLQFLENGVEKATVDAVLKKLDGVRKADKRTKALKLIIGGVATIAVAFLFTFISFSDGSPVLYVLYGMMTLGVMVAAKGIIDLF